MKTKKVLAVGASLFFALLLLGGATKAAVTTHKVVLGGLVVDSTTAGTTANTIYAHKDSTSYTITVPNKKNTLKSQNGKITLSEIYRDDVIKVWGKTSEGPQVIDATSVRDTSVQQIKGLHMATIFGKGPAGDISVFIQSSSKKVMELVEVRRSTKIIDGKTRKTFADLKVGDIVNVQGTWNTNLHIIYNTTQIKIRVHSMFPFDSPEVPMGPIIF